MSRRAWMPMYWGDYLADTGHLSALQHGVYLLLIGAYWMRGSLPDDPSQLRRICHLSAEEWDENSSTISAFFSPGWKHKRIDEELQRIAKTSKKRSAAGAEGNKKRWSQMRSPGDRKTIATHTHTQIKKERKKVPASDEAMELGLEQVPEPVNEDPKAKLYRIAKTILVSFGIPEKRTGALIGMWLKAKPDPVGLLAAIQYARDQNVAEPIAYISTLVNDRKPNGQHGQHWAEQAASDLIDQIRERQRAESAKRADRDH